MAADIAKVRRIGCFANPYTIQNNDDYAIDHP
jgi:hypothetical protein